ncbi:unnamed protein product [Amoebophrya sp. A120]|nr:unnamed protein product [Amoebophrya sp. A120]|eukprot:GSA120T00015679001.1
MGNGYGSDYSQPRGPGAPPPPPVVTNTFVLRNGRYESQALMPNAFDRDATGFEGGFPGANASQARMWRPLHPPDLKQTKLIQSPLHLRRALLKVSNEEGILWLEIGFDASCPVVLSLKVAKDSEEKFPFPAIEEKRKRGLKQTFRTSLGAAERVTTDGIRFVVALRRDLSLCKQASVINGQRSEIKIWKDAGSGNFKVDLDKQALQYAPDLENTNDLPPDIEKADCWDMQEVYGVKNHDAAEEAATGPNVASAADYDEGNTECIICMCEPRDTLVLPCRHMAFCTYCAGIMRHQCERCPICRQAVTSLLRFEKDEDEECDEVLSNTAGPVLGKLPVGSSSSSNVEKGSTGTVTQTTTGLLPLN